MLRRYIHGNGVDQPLLWYEGKSTDAASQRGLFGLSVFWHQGSIAAIADATGNAIAINVAACAELVSVIATASPMKPT